MTDVPNVMIEPCTHLCLCEECAIELRKTTKKCPMCRAIIQGFTKLTVTNSK